MSNPRQAIKGLILNDIDADVMAAAHLPNGAVTAVPDTMQGKDTSINSGYREVGRDVVNSQIALDFCGFEYCRPNHSFGPMARPVYIIHTVLEGKGCLRIGKDTYEIHSGQVFLQPPGVETFYWADKVDPWHYCWIGFHGTDASGIVRRIGLSKDHPVVTIENAELIENLIKNTMRYFELNVHHQLMRTGLLCTILAHLLEETQNLGEAASDIETDLPYDEYAIRYIQMHFREKIRINELADKIGISRSYLVRLVKSKIRMSPQEYLIKIRMEHALHYLYHTNDTIRDISASCGYDDSLAFSRAFRQYYGISPTEMREKMMNGMGEEMMQKAAFSSSLN